MCLQHHIHTFRYPSLKKKKKKLFLNSRSRWMETKIFVVSTLRLEVEISVLYTGS